jgi:ubiquinone/menaquinone biosynthesis C-methylase UbiE
LVRLLVDEFAPTGDVLEIACGSGAFTREIVRHANAVTALDGSPRMIERNRQEVADPRVNYVVADAFTWEPDRAYDAAVFSFWLSHVPPDDRSTRSGAGSPPRSNRAVGCASSTKTTAPPCWKTW